MLLLACAIIKIILKMMACVVKRFYKTVLRPAANVKIISKNVVININYNIYL